MSIYKKNYRKIWKEAFGEIPKDIDGRPHEIHHKDGNHNNNSIDNLMCISIQEHYDIHYKQKDYGACLLISNRMNISPQEKSCLASLHAKQQVLNGTHPWQTESYRKKQRIKCLSKANPFLGGNIQKISNQNRINNKTHHLLGSNSNKQMLLNGTHPSQKEWECEHCFKTGKGSTNYNRFHGNNCKLIFIRA